MERTSEEFGQPPDELFDEFDRRPLATASVGQVHVAVMQGRKVAVKVQRPDVERSFAGDLRLIAAATACIRRCRVSGLYWLLEPLSEFVTWTREELDYRIEARYMERLRLKPKGGAPTNFRGGLGFTTRRRWRGFIEGFNCSLPARPRR